MVWSSQAANTVRALVYTSLGLVYILSTRKLISMIMKLIRNIALIALLAMCVPFSRADEGMWLFNNPPYKTLQEKYHFQPTAAWLEHLQKSSVRFNSGGSGSFVFADGLVMTNHHVGADCLQKISTREKDYVQSGFEARSRSEEPKCVDLELNVLMS